MTLHLGRRGLGHQSRVGTGAPPPPAEGPENAEAAALFARFDVDPGSARRAAIDTCIGALKAAGVWAKLDVLYLLAAHDAQAGTRNWIQDGFNAEALGDPVFTADRGFTGGPGAYLDTQFNDLTGSALWSQDAMSAGAYINQYAGESNSFLGLIVGQSLRIGASATNINTRIHSNTSYNPAASGASPGHMLIVRDGPTSSRCFSNGVAVGTSSGAVSAAPSDAHVTAFRSANNYNSDRMACLHLGGALTADEAAALYAAIHAYLSALGAQ